MLKKTLVTLYIVVVAVMAIATIVEKTSGGNIYAQWWFTLLWALLTAAAVAWFVKRRVRRPSTMMLHLSFVIILLGAFLTHVSSRQGIVRLFEGQPSADYLTADRHVHQLPFALRLDSFVVVRHEGTQAVSDYQSHLTIIDGDKTRQEVVSMNNILNYEGIRLYQIDTDGRNTVLAMNSDPWGIPVTYCGYALLFIALVWMLFDPKGSYRQVLKSPWLRRGALMAVGFLWAGTLEAQTTLPKETAEKFGHLFIVYNGRVCPLQTYAIDFTKKLCGKAHYKDMTAEQVLTGFIFFAEEWNNEPLIKVKGSELKAKLRLNDRMSVNDFFRDDYILGPYVQKFYQGQQQETVVKQAIEMDDRLMLVMELQQGTSMQVFPCTVNGSTTWYSPADDIDVERVPMENRQFMGSFFVNLNDEIQKGRYAEANKLLERALTYQQQNGGTTIPADIRIKAEFIYNAVPFATILFIFNLAMGLLSLLFLSRVKVFKSLMALSFLALTVCEVLRWMIRGTIPMSNGYETMLLMAWFIQGVTLLLCHRFRILLTFGFLLSGFFLLVSHISQMDPQIGHLMPVLNSPLLSIHVSIIMMSFALLSLTFICGITALTIRVFRKNAEASIASLAMLSRVFLYPALTTLGIGIFIGAIWANISWGNYWSWDPKETWALITFMVYAVVVHSQSFPVFQRPMAYHLYTTLAYLTILMTYFGVNYFLGGLHSYA